MSNTVKTLLYPFLVGIRLFSRFRRGKILMYLLTYLFVFSFEGLLFFQILYVPNLVRTFVIMYLILGMIYVEFHFDDLDPKESL
jgi:hypothetical protein